MQGSTYIFTNGLLCIAISCNFHRAVLLARDTTDKLRENIRQFVRSLKQEIRR